MSDMNVVQIQLNQNEMKLQNLRQQRDNTLLGNYVKHVMDQELASDAQKK